MNDSRTFCLGSTGKIMKVLCLVGESQEKSTFLEKPFLPPGADWGNIGTGEQEERRLGHGLRNARTPGGDIARL